jgi:hypothetical protein
MGSVAALGLRLAISLDHEPQETDQFVLLASLPLKLLNPFDLIMDCDQAVR